MPCCESVIVTELVVGHLFYADLLVIFMLRLLNKHQPDFENVDSFGNLDLITSFSVVQVVREFCS